jgi:hypothetical protein
MVGFEVGLRVGVGAGVIGSKKAAMSPAQEVYA